MTVTVDQLPSILAAHAKWLSGEEGGVRADLTCANLTNADLTGAALVNANLIRAGLTRANLTGTNLTGSDLSRADLTGADLTDANLTDANLSFADLTDATSDGYATTTRPLDIMGSPWDIRIGDAYMRIGHWSYLLSTWRQFSDDDIRAKYGPNALEIWRVWKEPLLAMARAKGWMPNSGSPDPAD